MQSPTELETTATLLDRLTVLRRAAAPWSRGRLNQDELARLTYHTAIALEAETGELISGQRLAYASANALTYVDTVDAASIEWAAGKTAIVQSLQMTRGWLNTLCAAVEVEFSQRVSCSAYISAPKAQTFSMHVDEWDAFLIQIDGCKTFVFDADEQGDVQETLVAGDIVYMPRGLRHRAHSDMSSVHLSLNLLPLPPRV